MTIEEAVASQKEYMLSEVLAGFPHRPVAVRIIAAMNKAGLVPSIEIGAGVLSVYEWLYANELLS